MGNSDRVHQRWAGGAFGIHDDGIERDSFTPSEHRWHHVNQLLYRLGESSRNLAVLIKHSDGDPQLRQRFARARSQIARATAILSEIEAELAADWDADLP